ncbi:MAG: EB domain-containing protein [Polyangiaceae bacterium]|nr:EB domain-containing protein [Polyangiaceae bacterium]
MNKRRLFGTFVLMAASMTGFGCKDEEESERSLDGMGGAPGLTAAQELFDELQSEIDDLKAQLAAATGDAIPGLETALEEAEAQLEECLNLGACEGFSQTATALSALTDAICTQIYSCCEDSEAKATLGAAFADLDSCKSSYKALLVAPNQTLNLPSLPAGFENVANVGEIGDKIQSGRISLDSDALAACAEQLADQACGDEETPPVAVLECGEEAAENPCQNFIIGLGEQGDRCLENEECAEGFTCQGDEGQYNVCVAEKKEGDPCQTDSDCASSAELYCSDTSGTCEADRVEGEDCAFLDPSLNDDSVTLTVPCASGFYCSVETSKCVSECDRIEEDGLCNLSTNWCETGLSCSFSNEESYGDQVGRCEDNSPSYTEPGELFRTNTNSSEFYAYYGGGSSCENFGGSIYQRFYRVYNDDTCPEDTQNGPCPAYEFFCDEEAGESCTFDDQCQSDACFGDVCLAICSEDSDCGSGELCLGDACYPTVELDDDCDYTEQCQDTQFCNGGTCDDKGEDGDTCGSNDQCASGTYCDTFNLGECLTNEGRDDGDDCAAWYNCKSGRCDYDDYECKGDSADDSVFKAEGDDCLLDSFYTNNIEMDPCQNGLYCKRNDPSALSNREGTCTAQIPTGEVCDYYQGNTQIRQCAGNVGCEANSQGAYVCPVPVDLINAGEALSCTLSLHSRTSY